MSDTPTKMRFHVESRRIDAHRSESTCKSASITLDTDMGGNPQAFNPAELLLTALSACMIKGIERVVPILKFELRGVKVIVDGVRQDVPPKMESICYEIIVDTDESERRIDLLHDNVKKYGTVFNPDCPLAGMQRRGDGRCGCVGPETREPRPFSAGHGQHKPVLAGIGVPRPADGQHQAMQGGKRVLDSGAHHGLTEQAHQVAGQHGKTQRGFGGPEVTHVERIQAKVRLQLLDPVLTVRPAPAGAPHLHPRQIEAGHESAMAPALDVRIVREQRQCLARPQPEIGHPPRLTWTIRVDIHPNQIPVEGCATPSTATSGFCGG